MQYTEQWNYSFDYGIAIEIIRQDNYDQELRHRWCSYLLIRDSVKNCFPQNNVLIKSKIVDHMLKNEEFLDDLEGWNGGVTFKLFQQNLKTGQRLITIGHDYMHLWDYERGCDYSFDEIERYSYRIRTQAIQKFKEIGLLS